MRTILLLLLMMALPASADRSWRHYNLDVKLMAPDGWRITQGPVMVELSPKSDWKGERRPKYSLVWRQAPGTLEEFRKTAVGSVREKGGEVLASTQVKVGGYAGWKIAVRVKENGVPVRGVIILVRVDQHGGYLLQGESLEVDWAAAAPFFSNLTASLKLGARPRKSPLPLQE